MKMYSLVKTNKKPKKMGDHMGQISHYVLSRSVGRPEKC